MVNLFVTVDAGLTIGAGAGTGVGLTGIVPSVIQGLVFSKAASLGLIGPRLLDIADAYAQALVAQAALITLVSTHTPVFSGVGTITPGSIPVLGPEMGGNITIQGLSQAMIGPQWPSLATALGEGGAAGFLTATGSVAITGSGAPGTPGAGAGAGTLS